MSDEDVMLEKRLSPLETKLDMLLSQFKELNDSLANTYATKESVNYVDKRVEKLENAPTKWFAAAIALASLAVSIIAIYHK